MEVAVGQSLAAANDRGNILYFQCEHLQERLHFKHDVCTKIGDERHISNEMEGITKPLFGMQKYAPACKRFPPKPKRLWKRPRLLRPIFALPPPFIFFLGLAEIPKAEADERLINMSIGIIRQYGLHPLQS